MSRSLELLLCQRVFGYDNNCLDLFFISVSAEDREKFEKVESSKQQSKGKALFQRRKEREREEEEGEEKCNEEEEEERLAPVELLPGVDMDEMRMTVREKGLKISRQL